MLSYMYYEEYFLFITDMHCMYYKQIVVALIGN